MSYAEKWINWLRNKKIGKKEEDIANRDKELIAKDEAHNRIMKELDNAEQKPKHLSLNEDMLTNDDILLKFYTGKYVTQTVTVC